MQAEESNVGWGFADNDGWNWGTTDSSNENFNAKSQNIQNNNKSYFDNNSSQQQPPASHQSQVGYGANSGNTGAPNATAGQFFHQQQSNWQTQQQCHNTGQAFMSFSNPQQQQTQFLGFSNNSNFQEPAAAAAVSRQSDVGWSDNWEDDWNSTETVESSKNRHQLQHSSGAVTNAGYQQSYHQQQQFYSSQSPAISKSQATGYSHSSSRTSRVCSNTPRDGTNSTQEPQAFTEGTDDWGDWEDIPDDAEVEENVRHETGSQASTNSNNTQLYNAPTQARLAVNQGSSSDCTSGTNNFYNISSQNLEYNNKSGSTLSNGLVNQKNLSGAHHELVPFEESMVDKNSSKKTESSVKEAPAVGDGWDDDGWGQGSILTSEVHFDKCEAYKPNEESAPHEGSRTQNQAVVDQSKPNSQTEVASQVPVVETSTRQTMATQSHLQVNNGRPDYQPQEQLQSQPSCNQQTPQQFWNQWDSVGQDQDQILVEGTTNQVVNSPNAFSEPTSQEPNEAPDKNLSELHIKSDDPQTPPETSLGQPLETACEAELGENGSRDAFADDDWSWDADGGAEGEYFASGAVGIILY